MPSRPTTGTRKQAPAATPQALRIRPCDIAIFPCPFDGVAQGTFGSPPDPNAAVGAGDIVEVVNDQIQVTNRLGAVLCGGSITLQRLLRTSDNLTDPRVQFDNVNQRFSLSVTVSNPGASAHARYARSGHRDCGPMWQLVHLPPHVSRRCLPYGRVSGFSNAGPGPKRPAALAPDLP